MYSGHLCEKGGVRISESEKEENMCPHIREVLYRFSGTGTYRYILFRKVASLQSVVYSYFNKVAHTQMCPYYSGPLISEGGSTCTTYGG